MAGSLNLSFLSKDLEGGLGRESSGLSFCSAFLLEVVLVLSFTFFFPLDYKLVGVY
jgi:hypothetical protein